MYCTVHHCLKRQKCYTRHVLPPLSCSDTLSSVHYQACLHRLRALQDSLTWNCLASDPCLPNYQLLMHLSIVLCYSKANIRILLGLAPYCAHLHTNATCSSCCLSLPSSLLAASSQLCQATSQLYRYPHLPPSYPTQHIYEITSLFHEPLVFRLFLRPHFPPLLYSSTHTIHIQVHWPHSHHDPQPNACLHSSAHFKTSHYQSFWQCYFHEPP